MIRYDDLLSLSLIHIFGISIDKEKNRHISGSECEITGADSKVAVWVIATDEELTIARDTKEICERAGLL